MTMARSVRKGFSMARCSFETADMFKPNHEETTRVQCIQSTSIDVVELILPISETFWHDLPSGSLEEREL